MQRTPTLVVKLARASGQREDRYMHLLCGAVDETAYAMPGRASPVPENGGLEARVAALEAELQSLRSELEQLRASAISEP